MSTLSGLLDRAFDTIVARRKRAGAGALAAIAVAAGALTYTVQPGDTLSTIASAQCGTSAQWTDVYAQNKVVIGSNPNLIYPGTPLKFQCGQAGAKTAVVSSKVTGTGLPGRLLAEAKTRKGDWYAWGGAGPSVFDCSGLVYWSAAQLGIALPRDTYGMLAGSSHLVWVSSPMPGDLAFFGSGHVELWVSPGVTFGAQQTGTQVDFHSYGGGYVPTTFLRLR